MNPKYSISEILVGRYYQHMVFGKVEVLSKIDWPEFPDGVWRVFSMSQRKEFFAFNVKYFE